MNHIVVTGAAGYIGSALVRILLDDGIRVTAIDALSFGGESIIPLLAHPAFQFIHADVRQPESFRSALTGADGLVHLAAIVGDPACKKDPDLARKVNLDATKILYEMADQERVKRFVFASTCSNYGKMEDPNSMVSEDSTLAPISVYSETKVAAEKFLLNQARSRTCVPTCLRFSTVFGLSPRVRFDLTVNDFTKEVAMGRELVIFGDQFWRPYCHVHDLARSVLLVLQSATEKVAFDVFNVGDDSQNFQKRTLVDLIREVDPSARVRYVTANEDPRDYRVTFKKIRDRLDFRITKTVQDGIREIHRTVKSGMVMNPDDARYYNVPPLAAKAA